MQLQEVQLRRAETEKTLQGKEETAAEGSRDRQRLMAQGLERRVGITEVLEEKEGGKITEEAKCQQREEGEGTRQLVVEEERCFLPPRRPSPHRRGSNNNKASSNSSSSSSKEVEAETEVG